MSRSLSSSSLSEESLSELDEPVSMIFLLFENFEQKTEGFQKREGFQKKGRFSKKVQMGLHLFFPRGDFGLFFTFTKNLGFQKPRFLGEKGKFLPPCTTGQAVLLEKKTTFTPLEQIIALKINN